MVLLLLFCLFSFLLFLLLAPKSDSPKPPPPLLSSPLFRFTSFSSDLVLCGWDLLEPLGGLRLQQTPSLLSAQFVTSSGRQNLLRPWMFCEHWVWGLLPVRDFLDYPILGIDLSKLFFFKSPNTQIAWHLLPWTIRFDFSVVCLVEIKAPNFLPFRTSTVVVVLVIFWIVVKFCIVWCCCLFVVLFCRPLCKVLAITNVIFIALCVGFLSFIV